MQEIVVDLEFHGAHLVVISSQLENYSRQVAKKNKLSFSVLSDRGNAVASQFGLTFMLPEEIKELHNQWGMNLERFNGDASWTLPLRVDLSWIGMEPLCMSMYTQIRRKGQNRKRS